MQYKFVVVVVVVVVVIVGVVLKQATRHTGVGTKFYCVGRKLG